jgi:E3 ubiquitin-protein ligase HUWE1
MEIETCTKNAMPDDNQLNTTTTPFDRLSTIKAMLKFLLRMMESSGTTDGLRNLIDSSLPQSLKLIMEDPKLFGNSIFALAINVSTTFIHNEPTSLPILQEAKLPQSFLHTISTYDSPNNEVLMAAVNAFGAMCLNAQGLDMFNTEKPLPHFFELMTSHDFLRNPMDVDSATGLGSTMDELIRHHPSLKASVFQCVTSLIKKVIEMGSDLNGVGKSSDNSHLLQTSSEDTNMSCITNTTSDEEEKPEKVECLLVSFIDLVSRFLEGLFQNQSNIKEFVEEGCPEMLLNYYSLPLLPANFSVTIASDSLSYLFRMISEVSPLPTVLAIASKVKESIRFITEKTDDYQKSTLVEFVDVNATETDKVERGNHILRQMIQLHGYVGLLSNICCSSVLSHGRNGASLVTEFLSELKHENIIQLLGHLHRAMVWENLLLKEALPPAWYAVKSSAANATAALKKGPSSMTEHPLGIYSTNTQTEVSATTSTPNSAGVEEDSFNPSSSSTTAPPHSTTTENEASKNNDEKAPSAKDPRMVNIKHFKILLTEVPQLLMPIFQGLIKVSVSRRTGGALPKSLTMKLAEYMSDLLKDNITWSPITKPTAPACKYDYLTSVYTMTSLLLRDERTQSSLQTPLAIAFEKQGGIDLLLSNLKEMWTDAQGLFDQDKEKNKERFNRINSSIESLLNVLLHISSPKSLRDSAYTTTLIQKDKKAEDYFDPYEWIVNLELKLIPLKEYLTCPQLHLFSKTVNQTLIKIFQQIMKGEGGFANLSSSAASTARNGATNGDPFGNFSAPLMTSPFTLLRAPVVAAERNIQTLVDMGFERASAEQALVRCNNQVSRAVDYLFSHPTPIFGGSATVTTTATTTPPAPPVTETSSDAAPTNNITQENAQINNDASDNDDENEHQSENEDGTEEAHDDDDISLANDSDNNMEEVIDTFVESLNNEYNIGLEPSSSLSHLSSSLGFNGNSNNEAGSGSNGNKEPSENVNELRSVRQSLCDSLPVALLALADKREDLVFDVRDLLVILGKFEEDQQSPETKRANTTKTSINIITLLVDQIGEIRNDSSKSVLLSSRLRLLALLLREIPMQNAMNQLADRFSFLFDMLNFSSLGQDEPLPAWSATIFLVIEAFIAQSDEPKKVKLNTNTRRGGMFSSSSSDEEEDDDDNDDISLKSKDDKAETKDEDVVMEDVNAPGGSSTSKSIGISIEQRGKLLQCCVSLLRKTKLSRDDIYAILRMIVRLTKDHESALHFLGIGGVPLLFSKPRSSLEGLQGQQAFIILILRHIVESKAVLQSTMKDIITNWFTNPRPRNMDISSFVRSNAHVALREPDIFVEVTTDICRLARYDEFEINHQIKLKKQDDEKTEPDNSLSAKQASSSEVVVYYLLNEIMTIRTEATATASRKEPLTEEQKEEENIKFVYTGFLLQCLVELISSYPSCKYDIFNFCKKQNGQRTTTLDGKHRSFVSMLINDLLPYNHINPSSEESRKQQGLSTWTASTLVAMSYDASSSNDMNTQQKTELIQVRKYVLEAIVRSLKEAIASSETASIKYSKYLALADLCHRILNARPNVGSSIPRSLGGGQNNATNSGNNKEDTALSNAKIMLDKNFVAILTSAISDVDINYPHSKTILNSMLRPLEQLTKLAIKTDDNSDNDDEDHDKMDTAEEGMHVPSTPAAEGEEAPDLYRNSALGMFDAGSVIDDDEYNSGEYSDIFGSSADEEEE